MSDAGAQALARNTTLTSLDLGDNPIGDAAKKALKANTNLKKLTV